MSRVSMKLLNLNVVKNYVFGSHGLGYVVQHVCVELVR